MKHWGDLPAVADTDSAFAKMEREQLTKLRPMEVQGPRLYQTCSKQYSITTKSSPPEKFQVDPLTLHTIRLIQHSRKMKNIIQQVTLQHENAKPDTEITFPATLPMPEYTGPGIKPQVQQPFFQLLKDRDSNFSRGIGTPPPVIDNVSCRKLLRCSVAAVCAHIGFDNSKESSLELLTDILHEFYICMMKHLRSAVDNQLLQGHSRFPDVIEQVFAECGIGSVSDLHDFYQNRVIRYHENMLQQSQQLIAEYEKLKQAGGQKPTETFTLIRIKEGPSTDIQFPELDEKDDVAEAGQLLHLKGIGAYEITVEQESVTGLTTDIDSKISTNSKTENDNRLYLDDDGSSMIREASQQQCMESLTETNNNLLSVFEILPPLVNARTNKTKKLLHFLDDEEAGSLKIQDHPWSRQPSKHAHDNHVAPNSNVSALLPPPIFSAPPSKKIKLEESVDLKTPNIARLHRRPHSDQHDDSRSSINNSAVANHMTLSNIPARSSKKNRMLHYAADDESSLAPREAKRLRHEDYGIDNSTLPTLVSASRPSKSKRTKKM